MRFEQVGPDVLCGVWYVNDTEPTYAHHYSCPEHGNLGDDFFDRQDNAGDPHKKYGNWCKCVQDIDHGNKAKGSFLSAVFNTMCPYCKDGQHDACHKP